VCMHSFIGQPAKLFPFPTDLDEHARIACMENRNMNMNNMNRSQNTNDSAALLEWEQRECIDDLIEVMYAQGMLTEEDFVQEVPA